MKTIKVSDKGQISIPQSIRDNLEIERGDELILMQIDDKILLVKTEKMEQKIREDFKDLKKFTEQSLKEIWNNKSDDVWNNYKKDAK
jgi:AbrB family looped-hinge helix DNA binding protein